MLILMCFFKVVVMCLLPRNEHGSNFLFTLRTKILINKLIDLFEYCFGKFKILLLWQVTTSRSIQSSCGLQDNYLYLARRGSSS